MEPILYNPLPNADHHGVSYDVALDIVHFTVTEMGGMAWPADSGLVPPSADAQPSSYAVAMRELCAFFATKYQDVFDDMVVTLSFEPEHLYSTFIGVVEELFKDGFNYGRLIALYSFACALTLECARRNQTQVIGSVVSWTAAFVDHRLDGQFRQKGGWDGFLNFYERGQRQTSAYSPQLWTLAGACLIASLAGVVWLRVSSPNS